MDYGKSAGLPQYDSLHDPHLRDYYIKKFQNPNPPSGVSRSAKWKENKAICNTGNVVKNLVQ